SALDGNDIAADRLSSIAGDVRSVRSNLTFKIRQRSQIDSRLNSLAQELEGHNASLRRLITTGNNVCDLYQRAESSLLGLEVGTISWVQPAPNPEYVPASGEESQNILWSLIMQLLPEAAPGIILPVNWVDFDLVKVE